MDNFVFDLGGVLLNLPVEMAEERFDGKIRDILVKDICNSEEWKNLDRGTTTEAAATASFISRHAEFEREIVYFMNNWVDWFVPKTKTVKVIQYLKNSGKKLYILSNFHKKAYETIRERYDFFDIFDGGVISAYVHQLKPEKIIYETLINKYSLIPEKTVFIDDSPSNISAAAETGINSVLADDLDKALNCLLGMIPV